MKIISFAAFFLCANLFATTAYAEGNQTLLLLNSKSIYATPVQGTTYAQAGWNLGEELTFWQILNFTDSEELILKTVRSASIQTIAGNSITLKKPPVTPPDSTGDCGITESWIKDSKLAGELAGPVDAQSFTYGILIPPGFSQQQGQKADSELRYLIGVEQEKRMKQEPSDEIVKEDLALSAKFTNQGQYLWFVSSQDELRSYITVYLEPADSREKRILGTYDFVEACP